MKFFGTIVGLLGLASIEKANARPGETTGLRKPQSENNNQDQQVCLTAPFKEEQAQITLTWNYTEINCLMKLYKSLSTQTDINACKEATTDSKVNCEGNDINLKVNQPAKDMLTQGETTAPTPSPSSNPTKAPTTQDFTYGPTKGPTRSPTYPAPLPDPWPVNAMVAVTNAGAAAFLAFEAAASNYGIISRMARKITKSLAALLQCSPMFGMYNDPAATVQNPSKSEMDLSNSASNSMKADITYSIAQAALIIANIDKPSDIITALIIEANLANMIDNSVRADSGPHSRAEEANTGSLTRAGSILILVATIKKAWDNYYNQNNNQDDINKGNLKNRFIKEYGPTIIAFALAVTTVGLQGIATHQISGVPCNATSAGSGSGSGYSPINCDHGRENNGELLDPNGTTGVLLGAAAAAVSTYLVPKMWECWASRSENQKQELTNRFNNNELNEQMIN